MVLMLKERFDELELSNIRGPITFDKDLSKLSWLKVGGPAEVLFQPQDERDLSEFLKQLPHDIPIFPIGACSNLIIRDGGIPGVTVRLGRQFSEISVSNNYVTAGSGSLDSHVARYAAQKGIDLAFLRTIPGFIGGAVRMNAGCYGKYISDIFSKAHIILRDGSKVKLDKVDLGFRYRASFLPEGSIITKVELIGDFRPELEIVNEMESNIDQRSQTQPIREKSCGSTFKNPSGASSFGTRNVDNSLKAWYLIDKAGLRGFKYGGAQFSEKHPNFMINTGNATAADFERLGKIAIEKVELKTGIKLNWEVKRVGIKRLKLHSLA